MAKVRILLSQREYDSLKAQEEEAYTLRVENQQLKEKIQAEKAHSSQVGQMLQVTQEELSKARARKSDGGNS